VSAVGPTVAILSIGEMGSGIGALLARGGLRVITSLEGRSPRTRRLAAAAGIEDVASDAALAAAADLVLSVIVPSEAEALARRLAPALAGTAAPPVVVDCNAIAPETTKAVGSLIEATGARFVDGGIIGPPPGADSSRTRLYVSGPAAEAALALCEAGLDVRTVGDRVGDASALKMCYAALNKGTAALMLQLLVAAERLGVADALRTELGLSQGAQLERMGRLVPDAVPKAFRWVGEMDEIARTFEAVGITGRSFEGAARTFGAVAATELGKLRVESFRERDLRIEALVSELARALPKRP
jgi:3-hydroxyisobutyrate dehydrogenase-like beta-hydroxyacid dehydrogenase